MKLILGTLVGLLAVGSIQSDPNLEVASCSETRSVSSYEKPIAIAAAPVSSRSTVVEKTNSLAPASIGYLPGHRALYPAAPASIQVTEVEEDLYAWDGLRRPASWGYPRGYPALPPAAPLAPALPAAAPLPAPLAPGLGYADIYGRRYSDGYLYSNLAPAGYLASDGITSVSKSTVETEEYAPGLAPAYASDIYGRRIVDYGAPGWALGPAGRLAPAERVSSVTKTSVDGYGSPLLAPGYDAYGERIVEYSSAPAPGWAGWAAAPAERVSTVTKTESLAPALRSGAEIITEENSYRAIGPSLISAPGICEESTLVESSYGIAPAAGVRRETESTKIESSGYGLAAPAYIAPGRSVVSEKSIVSSSGIAPAAGVVRETESTKVESASYGLAAPAYIAPGRSVLSEKSVVSSSGIAPAAGIVREKESRVSSLAPAYIGAPAVKKSESRRKIEYGGRRAGRKWDLDSSSSSSSSSSEFCDWSL